MWYRIQGSTKEAYIGKKGDMTDTKLVFDGSVRCDVNYFLFNFENVAEVGTKDEGQRTKEEGRRTCQGLH